VASAKILKECIKAIQSHNFDKAAKCLEDNFQFLGADHKPISKQEWLTLHKALGHAFPDFSFNLVVLEENHGKVTGHFSFTGTHKDTLDLLLLGIRLPATGMSIQLPVENFTAQFHGGLLHLLEMQPVEDGGFAGILKQLHVAVPG
jgi:predicted ester cyclase